MCGEQEGYNSKTTLATKVRQTMSRRLWHKCSTCTTENDLKVFREKNVFTHRTEELTSGVSITYKCSEDRKYSQCRYQLKAKQLDVERMLGDWSTKNATDGSAHTINFEADLESKAHQWSQKIDQSQIIRLSNTGYVIPTTNLTMNTNVWLQQYYTMSWNSYDEYISWFNSEHLVHFSLITAPWYCTCRFGQKEYSCVHTIGLMIIWGFKTIPQIIDRRKGKGRSKKVKAALTKD
ncbi:unnamed protein product [Didymodactylos carnosus]|uniref:SWIM-type domain-containing protein n=1 Tax=Didymodactylos carnosus TaxID=1234261 RepID=A0A814W5W7_9BILA|nr:unnamed protein product [Didymodactylos carnosus]CAF1194365.1 unnamed protein product [Didymodactylos carnosus]CAF3954661.1 unnamed protein product [Didymodactylos carnosus]CAF3958725.1 unnamed protein product [Didymodactylos carnosus]